MSPRAGQNGHREGAGAWDGWTRRPSTCNSYGSVAPPSPACTPFRPLRNKCALLWGVGRRRQVGAPRKSDCQVPACLTLHSSLTVFSPESLPRLLMSPFCHHQWQKGPVWQLSPGSNYPTTIDRTTQAILVLDSDSPFAAHA